jgi:hypothetical protein
MIAGYPASASMSRGDTLVLHVSTTAPRFRVLFYRWADGLVPMHGTGWLPGKCAPPRGAADDWDWPAYPFRLRGNWPSAVYLAFLDEGRGARLSLAADSAAILFVLRGDGQGKLLYKLPLATWHAYNFTGGGCFYKNPPRSLLPPGGKVSFRRPGGGIGGAVWCSPDYYDPRSPRQTFAHWDAPFIAWLARNGYAPDFCTGLDLGDEAGILDQCRLLLTAGHDEYWSEAERNAVESHIDNGGNAAFFGGNTCWWRIRPVDKGGAMVCHQGGPNGALDQWWPASGAGRPEDALCGTSYRHGGGWWDGAREAAGYVVQQSGHWVFAGTGLSDGDAFGAATSPPLIGYECDGAPLASFDRSSGRATLARGACGTATPASLELLAASVLDGGWQELPAREGGAAGEGIHAAAMSVHTHGGTVFSAGTTDWAQVLGSGQDRCVDIITRNVIERLQAS